MDKDNEALAEVEVFMDEYMERGCVDGMERLSSFSGIDCGHLWGGGVV